MAKKATNLEQIGEGFEDVMEAMLSPNRDAIPRSIGTGNIYISDIELSCAVLDNEKRIIINRSLANFLGVKGSGAYWKKKKEEKGALLPEYISANYLKPFIHQETILNYLEIITYENERGELTEAISAESITAICDIWVQAWQKGALSKTKENIGQKAYDLLRATSKVGIIALIDEATGYQYGRNYDALRILINRYLDEYAREWTKEFPDEFFIALDHLFGNKKTAPRDRPSYYGKFIKRFIYKPIENGIILDELEKLNPKNESGYRKKRFHQYLTEGTGIRVLRDRISKITGLMQISESYKSFTSKHAKMESKQDWFDFSNLE